MVDRRDIGSWLEGPGARARQLGTDASTYPGERLGLAPSGRGSVGRFGRRLVGVLVDWTLCQLVAAGLFGVPLPFTVVESNPGPGIVFLPLAVFFAMNLLLVGTLGTTVGHRVVGLQVRSLDGGPVRPLQTLVRTVLLTLFLPAMFWDRDGRGTHDRAAGTVLVRTRDSL